VGTDKGNLQAGFGGFHPLRQTPITCKSGSTGEDDNEIVLGSDASRLFRAESMGRPIQKATLADQAGRVGEPCGIPEGSGFARCRVTRTRPPVEIFKGGRIQEQSLHFDCPYSGDDSELFLFDGQNKKIESIDDLNMELISLFVNIFQSRFFWKGFPYPGTEEIHLFGSVCYNEPKNIQGMATLLEEIKLPLRRVFILWYGSGPGKKSIALSKR
jgi:hypothetical protein